MTGDEIDAALVGVDLPPGLTMKQRRTAAEIATRVRDATPARGGDRVAVLRDLGWTHGVCYTLNEICSIAVWTALGEAEEKWATMPRRGRPKGTVKDKDKGAA